ncbi:heme exporter protein CcmD [Azohydromonas caseinilytica]|uniref:Heme exporter protein D n=1 Tax=Azohydromonas caseinilytica TaxID=2728836 RepID=A0A848FJC4_9BURK|nr:heme exporter protein CcmD [Azohydromonas caseinilytica]NML18409.1 heme exporter protein CcmD [Azohydromonas caseinilytica]
MTDIDWALFWHMGGHGAYVWTGWGLALLALGVEFFTLWRRSRRHPPPSPAVLSAAGRSGAPREASRDERAAVAQPAAPGRGEPR